MKLNTLVTLMVYSVTGAILLVIFVLYFAQITRATRMGAGYCPRGGQNPADSPTVIRA
jgi:two-component system sensor histidine kinase DcuS